MYSFRPEVLDRLTSHGISRALSFIHETRGKQGLYEQKKPEVLEALRQVAIFESVESSNRLENVVVSQDVLREINRIKRPINKSNRDEGEIAGYRKALDFLHQNYATTTFDLDVVLKLHADLMQFADEGGGVWKKEPNFILARLPDGKKTLRARTTDPEHVKNYMHHLHEAYAHTLAEKKIDPLICIALYVLDFLCIHPFSDGNGRTVRLITVLLLYHQNYRVVGYISLEKLIEDSKHGYYDTLYRSDRGWHDGGKHNPMPWVEYFLGVLVAASKRFTEKIEAMSSSHGIKRALAIDSIDKMLGDFSIKDLEQKCPSIGRDTLRSVLRTLKKEGYLETIGKGPRTKWRKTGKPMRAKRGKVAK